MILGLGSRESGETTLGGSAAGLDALAVSNEFDGGGGGEAALAFRTLSCVRDD